MQDLLLEFRNGGFPNLIVLFLGFWGLLLGISALIVGLTGGRMARTLGAVSVSLAIAILVIGALGVAKGHSMTNSATAGASINPIQKERIQREGYRESKSCAKFGIGCALIPFIGGAAALLIGSRRREDELVSPTLLLPFGLLGASGVFFAVNILFIGQKLPGRDLDIEDPTWRLIEAKDAIDTGDLARGCIELEDALDGETLVAGREYHADPSKIPAFDEAAGRCVDAKIDAALKEPEGERRAALRSILERTRPVLVDESHKKRILDQIATVPAPSPAPAPFGVPSNPGDGIVKPTAKMGTMTVTGRLPIEVVQRIVRANMARFRFCFEQGLKANPMLEGDVVAHFVIDAKGDATNVNAANSPLKDKTVVACITHALTAIGYPAPVDGGVVSVTLPLHFGPPAPPTP